MALEGEIYNYPSDTASPFRGYWTPEENGDVIQRFVVFNLIGYSKTFINTSATISVPACTNTRSVPALRHS